MTTEINPLGFPSRHSSVTAEVLARFLNHERLTSLDAVAGASTTRLAALVHYLSHAYGWPITSQDKAASCSDGRVAHVSEYHLPAEAVERGMAAGGAAWCANVRTAREAQRFEARDAAQRVRQVSSGQGRAG